MPANTGLSEPPRRIELRTFSLRVSRSGVGHARILCRFGRLAGRRTAISAAITITFYIAVFCNPMQFAVHDLMQPGAANNAYSPYTMYERCHPEQFDLPAGLSC